MHTIHRRLAVCMVVWVLFVLTSGSVWAGDAVPFSGNVKKVIKASNKVAIKDPVNKKRFTVVLDGKSKLTGITAIDDLQKGDSVSGKYVVTDQGLYVVTEMTKK